MAACYCYCLGIKSNDFFLKDNKKAFILWLNVPKVTAYYGDDFSNHVLIYQSEKFRGKTPKEVSYYNRLIWTPEVADIPSSVNLMRDEMFKNPFSCGVFIGGMDGIIDEAKRFHVANPKSDMIVVPNTGGASTVLSERTNLDFIVLPDTYAYVSEFKRLLKKYQDVI